MIVYDELRSMLERAVKKDISPPALFYWVEERSYNMHKDSSEAAQELASSIELIFFEMSTPIDSHGTVPDWPNDHPYNELSDLWHQRGRWTAESADILADPLTEG